MENLRNQCKTCKQQKILFKTGIQTKLYVTQNIWQWFRYVKAKLYLRLINLHTLECKLSKALMYEFHYDYIKNKYRNNSRLLFTDTDSLMYEIKTEDVYKGFSNNKELFDFSNYSSKSKYHDNSNKLVVGKMKDETVGVAIEVFVGLKPKMYSYLVDDISEHEKVKAA